MRKCKECGKEFNPKNKNQLYCNGPHFRKCPICGKEYEVKYKQHLNRPPVACSYKCRAEKTKRTSLERYGCTAPGNNPEARAKSRATMTERYGAAYTLQSKELTDKVKSTTKERYGVENAMQNAEINAKAAETDKANHGGVRAFNTEDSYRHRKETIEERYGSESELSLSFREKVKQPNIERYGAEHPMMNEDILAKQQASVLEHYGVMSALSDPEVREKGKRTMLDKYGVDNAMKVEEFVLKAESAKKGTGRRSQINLAFESQLDTIGIEYESEKFLDGKWFDIYIPDQNLVIEINPTYTHSAVNHHTHRAKDPNYHLDKVRIAKNNGLRCIHIFDWDNWDKILGMIDNSTKLNARNCSVITPTKEELDKFLEENHLQGTCRGQSIVFGLEHDGELVEVMTFGTPRYNKNYDTELLRLCTKSGYMVRGGASKLFSHAIKTNNLGSIISYCDLSKFDGSVYESIGMTKVKDTSPGKIWSYHGKKITSNLLNQRGFDQLFGTDYGKGTSNEELMLEHNWLPIYDCGQRVYEYKNM